MIGRFFMRMAHRVDQQRKEALAEGRIDAANQMARRASAFATWAHLFGYRERRR